HPVAPIRFPPPPMNRKRDAVSAQIPAVPRVLDAPTHVNLMRETARSKNAHEAVDRISRPGQEWPAIPLPEAIPGGFGVAEDVFIAFLLNLMIDPSILHRQRHWRDPFQRVKTHHQDKH